MDHATAFMMGDMNRHKELMVFDWLKAASIIRDRKPAVASAGLRDDWEYTGGDIWRDGKPVAEDDTYTYLASTWAVPELDIDGEVIECFVWKGERPEWNSKTYWPPEALKVLEEQT